MNDFLHILWKKDDIIRRSGAAEWVFMCGAEDGSGYYKPSVIEFSTLIPFHSNIVGMQT